MPTGAGSILLKIAAVLWVIWGLVHLLAGVIVLNGNFEPKCAGRCPRCLDINDLCFSSQDRQWHKQQKA